MVLAAKDFQQSDTVHVDCENIQPKEAFSESMCNSSTLRNLATPHPSYQSVESQSTQVSGGGQQVNGAVPRNTDQQKQTSNNGREIQQTTIGQVLSGAINGVTQGTTQAQNSRVQDDQASRQIQWESSQNEGKLGATESGMVSAVWGKVSSMLQAVAETQATLGSYPEIRKFQEETCEDLGAIGANPTVVNGASIPLVNQSTQGLSFLGSLGKSNQEQALLAAGVEVNGQSFIEDVAAMNKQLRNSFGAGGVRSQFVAANIQYSRISEEEFNSVPNADSVLSIPSRIEQKKVREGQG